MARRHCVSIQDTCKDSFQLTLLGGRKPEFGGGGMFVGADLNFLKKKIYVSIT